MCLGSLPNPTQICSESTHRIWYKLKTKLGPRKTIRKERVSTSRETCPSRYWEQWGSLTPSGRSRVAGLDLRMLGEGPKHLHCCLPHAHGRTPSSQTEPPAFGEQILWLGIPLFKGTDYPGKEAVLA